MTRELNSELKAAPQGALTFAEAEALAEEFGLIGIVHAVLLGPDGKVKDEQIHANLVTQVGDQLIGERAFGIATPPAQVTGMRLGTGTTAVAKTGVGAAIVTYVAGSNAAIAAGYPTSSLSPSNARRITFQASWAAGIATNAALSEAVLVNDAIATDAASLAANTISRVLLSPIVNKGAADTFTLTWSVDHLGS